MKTASERAASAVYQQSLDEFREAMRQAKQLLQPFNLGEDKDGVLQDGVFFCNPIQLLTKERIEEIERLLMKQAVLRVEDALANILVERARTPRPPG